MWEKGDSESISRKLLLEVSPVACTSYSPKEIASRRFFLGEAEMENFISETLKNLGKTWGEVKVPPQDKEFYINHAVDAGLLVRVNGKLFFPDKAKSFLATRAGLKE